VTFTTWFIGHRRLLNTCGIVNRPRRCHHQQHSNMQQHSPSAQKIASICIARRPSCSLASRVSPPRPCLNRFACTFGLPLTCLPPQFRAVQKVNLLYTQLSVTRIKICQQCYIYIELWCRRSATILLVGIKYSMGDVICIVTRKAAHASRSVIDVSAPSTFS